MSSEEFKCYLAHPYESQNSEEIQIIKDELVARRVKVVNPFDGENELMLEKYGRECYYPNPPFQLAVDVWTKDMRQVSECDMLLVYVPDGKRLSGGCGVELFKAWQEKKFIQIISKSRHPVFAYVLAHSNGQMFESIENWKKYKELRWAE